MSENEYGDKTSKQQDTDHAILPMVAPWAAADGRRPERQIPKL